MFFFFNDTATTEIYTLSLHDALPISPTSKANAPRSSTSTRHTATPSYAASHLKPPASARSLRSAPPRRSRSEEHTSELQSRQYLVCRLLLEKKKQPRVLVIIPGIQLR